MSLCVNSPDCCSQIISENKFQTQPLKFLQSSIDISSGLVGAEKKKILKWQKFQVPSFDPRQGVSFPRERQSSEGKLGTNY